MDSKRSKLPLLILSPAMVDVFAIAALVWSQQSQLHYDRLPQVNRVVAAAATETVDHKPIVMEIRMDNSIVVDGVNVAAPHLVKHMGTFEKSRRLIVFWQTGTSIERLLETVQQIREAGFSDTYTVSRESMPPQANQDRKQ